MQVSRPLLLALMALLIGCATVVAGPEPPFDPSKLDNNEFVNVAESFKKLAQAASEVDRDTEMNKLLALVDGRYSVFVRKYVATNRHGSAAAKSALNAATIAGGLTDSKGVKDNWLALARLISGEQLIYDKTYLDDQPVTTVVAQMNAGRKQKLVEIREAMTRNVSDYPGQMALVDILDYYGAGTPMGATLYAARAASSDAASAEASLRLLDDVRQEQIEDTRKITARLFAFVQGLSLGGEEDLKKFLAALAVKPDKGVDSEDPRARKIALNLALKRLHDIEFRNRGGELIARLQNAGFTVP